MRGFILAGEGAAFVWKPYLKPRCQEAIALDSKLQKAASSVMRNDTLLKQYAGSILIGRASRYSTVP